MTEIDRLLENSAVVRTVLSAVRLCPLSVPQMAHVLRGRWCGSTVRQAVRMLRIAGLVRFVGRRTAWPSHRPAKFYRAV